MLISITATPPLSIQPRIRSHVLSLHNGRSTSTLEGARVARMRCADTGFMWPAPATLLMKVKSERSSASTQRPRWPPTTPSGPVLKGESTLPGSNVPSSVVVTILRGNTTSKVCNPCYMMLSALFIFAIKDHLRSHCGVTDLICPLCDKGFTTIPVWKRHQKSCSRTRTVPHPKAFLAMITTEGLEPKVLIS